MHMTHKSSDPASDLITFEQFLAVDIRVGRIVAASPVADARKPSLRLSIDFGAVIGIKTSCAQITEHYTSDTLIGRMVAAVVNFPPRQIGKTMSQVLTLGFPDEHGAVVLVTPSINVPVGGRLF
jgi:tRNA-binding protein